VPHCLPVTVCASLQAEIDDDAVAAPQRIVQLLQLLFRRLADPEIDAHLFAPQRPSLIKDGVLIEDPTPLARVRIRENEL